MYLTEIYYRRTQSSTSDDTHDSKETLSTKEDAKYVSDLVFNSNIFFAKGFINFFLIDSFNKHSHLADDIDVHLTSDPGAGPSHTGAVPSHTGPSGNHTDSNMSQKKKLQAR
jgi:hypothetical protein